MPDPGTCPTNQQLVAYGLGNLPPQAEAAVEAHLKACAPCRKVVASLPPDSFLRKVRAAQPGASTSDFTGCAR